MRRVVVTRLEASVTQHAAAIEPTWSRLLAGASGAGPITSFDAGGLARIACNIPRGDGSDGTFNPDQWMEPERRKVDDFIVFAMAAAAGVCGTLNWKPASGSDPRTGVAIIGIGTGSAASTKPRSLLEGRGPRRLSPFFSTAA